MASRSKTVDVVAYTGWFLRWLLRILLILGLQGAVQLVGRLLRQAMSPGKTTIVKLVGGTCTWRFPLLIYMVSGWLDKLLRDLGLAVVSLSVCWDQPVMCQQAVRHLAWSLCKHACFLCQSFLMSVIAYVSNRLCQFRCQQTDIM